MTVHVDRVAAALPAYDIDEEVGRGGAGVVLRGTHRRLGREVAIKVLLPEVAADPGVQRRFATEARLLASLDHPHIVRVFDYVESGEICLLVMELLSGGTVKARFSSHGVSPFGACSIALATCSALEYAHRLGILHRDIKPANLVFNTKGTLKVTDFGIAKVVGGSTTLSTGVGEVLGTPAYIAPEQVVGGKLGATTDVYALGAVLYQLLAGRLPFPEQGSPVEVLYRHAHEEPTPIREVAPLVPAPIAEVIMRSLAHDAGERFPDAEALGVAIVDASNAAWGPGWVDRSGLPLLVSGAMAEHLSLGDSRSGVRARDVAAAPGSSGGQASLAAAASPPSTPSLPPPPAPAPAAAGDGVASSSSSLSPPSATPSSAPLPPAAPSPAARPVPGPATPAVPSLPPSESSVPPYARPPSGASAPTPSAASRAGREPAAASLRTGGIRVGPRTTTPRTRLIVALVLVLALVAVSAVLVATRLGSKSGSPSSGAGGPAPSAGGPASSSAANPQPPGRLLFSDDFTNAASGWAPDPGQGDTGTAQYQGGAYVVTVQRGLPPLNTYSVASPFAQKLPSIVVVADVALAQGAGPDGGATRCDQGGRTGLRYSFEVHGDGSWVIFKIDDAGPASLAEGTSPAVRTGSAANTVQGQCTEVAGGTRLVMTVNGTPVGSATDAHPAPATWHGALAVYRSQSSGGTTVQFTKYRLYDSSSAA